MFELPKLNYKYSALEPYIDEETMKIHHAKHHQGYVNKLNGVLKGSEFEGKELEWLLKNLGELPKDLQIGVRNNGGGHFNHSLFWQVIGASRISPSSSLGINPEGELKGAIEESFGSLDKFKEEFTQASLSRFGSGWVWLCQNEEGLQVCSTANQDNCFTDTEAGGSKGVCQPILTIDLWEHAYYLKYQNRRDEYIENFFKVINWKKVGEKYEGIKT
jgi:superoxide dismutase, Fe-Mn family